MWNKLKAFALWVYEWATVIAATLVSALVAFFDALELIGIADWTPLLPANHALKIVTTVALVKGVCALIRAKTAAV